MRLNAQQYEKTARHRIMHTSDFHLLESTPADFPDPAQHIVARSGPFLFAACVLDASNPVAENGGRIATLTIQHEAAPTDEPCYERGLCFATVPDSAFITLEVVNSIFAWCETIPPRSRS